MTNNSTYRTSHDLRNNLPQAIIEAEGSKGVGFPASGTSGLSVGAFQIDLGARSPERRAFIDAGVRSGAIKDQAEAERLFAIQFDEKRMKPGTPERRQFDIDSDRAKDIAREAMQRPEVRAVVDQASSKQVNDLVTATERVCRQAGPQARAYCNSRQGQLEIATYLHQYGASGTAQIEAYLRGETVTLGAGEGTQARRVRIQGTLDSEQFRNGYQGSTHWGQKNSRSLNSRHERLDGYFRQQKIDDGSRARINPGQRSDAAPAEQAPAQQQASLSNEQAPEQSANIAAESEQPSVQRTSWTPDRTKIGEAIASLKAQDLPQWTQDLLGRDVMANGAKSAVMGFQRAINAGTKPPGFDYQWGLGGRTGRIDVDGDLGPQTRAGFGRAVEKQGEDGFKKLYALDQFGRYVKDVDRGRAKLDDLETTIGGTLGQAIPDAPERAQETLNMFAEDREEPGAPLKVDGWIGPKTTEAFGSLLRKTSPDAMTTRFAGKDFWEDEDLA